MGIREWIAGNKKSPRVESAMFQLISKLQTDDFRQRQHRNEERVAATIGVRVTPCFRSGKPDTSAGFDCVTRDVTPNGVSFIHRRQFSRGEKVVVSIPVVGDDLTHFVCEVRHSTDLQRGMFCTGCEMIDVLETLVV